MAVQLTAPGVYVEEIPSGARAIAGVSTSATAFIGRAGRSSVDGAQPPLRIGSWADFERACGGLSSDSELSHAVRHFFLAGGREALIVRVVHVETGSESDPTASAITSGLVMGPGSALALEARDPGAWGDLIRVTVDHGGALDAVGPDGFHLTVAEVDPDDPTTVVRQESFRFLSVDPASSRYAVSVLAEQSRLVQVVPGTTLLQPAAAGPTALTGGSDGPAPTATDMETAIDRLMLADVVNLVCIPPFAADGTSVASSVYTKALVTCEALRAMLVVDPDDAWVDYDAAAAMTNLTGLVSPNTIMYYPRILAPDPLKDGLVRAFAPCGMIAGTIARTDGDRGVWKAPAGLEATLRGVGGLTDVLTDDRIGVANARGVNVIATRPVVGPVLWGSRTAVGADTRASEWKYVPVRRTALFIEESLRRGLQWAVFEPNDTPLHAQIRVAVGTFMQRLFMAGAFQGTTPKEAYLVKCDAETTTQADIDQGIVNVLVGFAPLKPAEFVVLKFQQITGEAG